jgi:hypothetical protein
MSFATMMVHVDAERDSEQRVQLALGLADRFQATLIGVAGLALRPAFSGGPVVVYSEPTQADLQNMKARLEDMGRKFCARASASADRVADRARLPDELVAREARASDLVIVGSRHLDCNRRDRVDPGVILLRAGRPVLVGPDIIAPLQLRRVVVAWKDARECRRAVRDALPLLQEAKEVLLVEIGESESKARAKSALADVATYLVRHRVIVADQIWRQAHGPVASELSISCATRAPTDRRRRLWQVDWVNGSSAASPTSFWRRAVSAACCLIDAGRPGVGLALFNVISSSTNTSAARRSGGRMITRRRLLSSAGRGRPVPAIACWGSQQAQKRAESAAAQVCRPAASTASTLQPTGQVDGDPLYEIAARSFRQQLHRDLPATPLGLCRRVSGRRRRSARTADLRSLAQRAADPDSSFRRRSTPICMGPIRASRRPRS